MPIITKTVSVISKKVERELPATKTLWRALEIEFANGQVEWIVSHAAAIPFLPAGASVSSARLQTAFDYKRNCGYLSGKATISAPSYEILDVDNAFSDEIATKLVNGIGTYNNVIREYEWDAETPLPITGSYREHSKGAWLFRDHTNKEYGTTVTVNCADIHRGLDGEIFNPLLWTLDHTAIPVTDVDGTNEHVITADQTVFTTTINADDFTANPDTFWRPFEQGAHYHHHAGETGTYLRLDATGQNGKRKEVVWASNMRVEGGRVVVDVERGQKQTTAQQFSVTTSTTASNGPKLTEWIFLDEIITTMFRALVTGFTGPNGTGRALPSHWTAGADSTWIDENAISDLGLVERISFENPDKSKVKAFIEKEVLPTYLSVLPINNKGQLRFKKYFLASKTSAAGAAAIVFNESNCKTDQNISLRHKKDEIYSTIQYQFDWDPHAKQFQNTVSFVIPESESFNKTNRTKVVSLKGIHSGLHVDSLIKRLATFHGNAHAFEQQEITLESSINDIELGEVVRVKFTKPVVIDDANGTAEAKPLDRLFTVIAANESRNTTVYTLRGTLDKITTYIQSVGQDNIADAAFAAQFATIQAQGSADGTERDLGVMAATGTINLEMGKTYFHDGNLTVAGSVNVNITGTSNAPITFVTNGYLDWTPDINLTGLSARQIASGETATTDIDRGNTGYIGGQPSSYNYNLERVVQFIPGGSSSQGNQEGSNQALNRLRYVVSSYAPRRSTTNVARTALSDLTVTNVDGFIQGIPANLAGSSGAGSYRSKINSYQTGDINSLTNNPEVIIDGDVGGQSGGSLVWITKGGIMRGVVTTSGTQGGYNSVNYGGQTVYGAKGGSGEPSPWIWITTASVVRPVIDANNFHAYLPTNGYPDGRFPRPFDNVAFDAGNPIHPIVLNNDDPAGENRWAECSLVIDAPPLEVLSDLPVYESSATEQAEQIIAVLESQLDGEIELFISDTDPGNGNVDDLVITQANLDSLVSKPPIRYLTDSGWADFDWETGSSALASVYSSLIYLNREHGTTKILVSTTRPTEFTDGQVWFNPETDLSYILSSNGAASDTIYNLGQIQTGDNLYRDGRFTLQREYGDQWVFLDDINTLPTLFGGGTLGGVVSGSGQLPAPTINALPYNATTVGIFVGLPADTNNITGYEITRDGTLITTLSHPTAYYEDTTTAEATTYTYAVRAVGGATASEYASQSVTTPTTSGGGGGVVIDPPTNLTHSVYSDTAAELFWNVTTDTDATGYKVYRDGVEIASPAGIGTGSYYDNTLTPNTTYNYEVRAADNSGNLSSAITTTLTTNSVVIDAPTNLVATASGQNQINLTWTATTDTDATAYDVLRDGVVIASPSPRTANSYSDTGLTAGTQYNYTLRAKDGSNNYSGTVAASATTDSAPTLGAPSNLTGSVYGTTNLELFWNSATDSNVAGYRIHRDGVFQTDRAGIGTGSYYTDTLSAGTTYTFTVRSYDSGGNTSAPLSITLTTNS